MSDTVRWYRWGQRDAQVAPDIFRGDAPRAEFWRYRRLGNRGMAAYYLGVARALREAGYVV